MTLAIIPCTLKEAEAYIRLHHRHHRPKVGSKGQPMARFAIGAAANGTLVGVAVVSNPTARLADDGFTVEVARMATDWTKNACSMLYAACWRAARALGFRRLITYTLATEPGTSLRAAGWTLIGEAGGGPWSRPSRPRDDQHPTQGKLRWEAA